MHQHFTMDKFRRKILPGQTSIARAVRRAVERRAIGRRQPRQSAAKSAKPGFPVKSR
jgi:hypothetical protein